MRLNPEQINCIKATTMEMVGADASVLLFGSRTDDTARGGDIDLYVETPRHLDRRIVQQCQLAARLERQFGGQRVDVVLRDADTPLASIHAHALKYGQRL